MARDCYSMRLELLTNSNVINDSMRFIEKAKEKEKQNLSNKKENIGQQEQEEEEEEKKIDIQGLSEINNNTAEEQYNQVF